jgi:hypothetical protein
LLIEERLIAWLDYLPAFGMKNGIEFANMGKQVIHGIRLL